MRRGNRLSDLTGSTAIIVLGAPRSGTSALTGTLSFVGVDVGERLLGASSANPRGYWEHRDIMEIHDLLLRRLDRPWSDARPLPEGWLESRAAVSAARRIGNILKRDFVGKKIWAVKDPRLCRLLPLWRPILRDAGIAARYVLAVRDPAEAIASLRRGFPASPSYAELLWLRYVLESEAETRAERRTLVNYRDLLGTASERMLLLQRIGNALSIEWPVPYDSAEPQLNAFLSSELRRERAGAAGDRAQGWTDEIAAAFAAGDGPALRAACDKVAERLRQVRIERVELPAVRRRSWVARQRDGVRAAATGAADRLFHVRNSILRLRDRGGANLRRPEAR